MDQQDKLDAALWTAVLNDNIENAAALLRMGADPDASSDKAYISDIEAYRERQKAAHPNAWFPEGSILIGDKGLCEGKKWKPLNVAAAHGQEKIVERLHAAGGRG